MPLMEGTHSPSPAVASTAAEQATTISPLRRALLLTVGTAALVVGVVGIVVPVLPTTPFLLVTAACYARASTRLYEWLLGQPPLGPIVTEWRRSRALPPGAKTRALIVVAATFAISIIVVDSLVLRLALLAIAVTLAVFLYRLPTAQPTDVSVRMEPAPRPEDPR